MPLERPRRSPVVMENGQNDPRWLQYFDNLDTDQTESEGFEAATRFQAGETGSLSGSVRQLKAAQRETLHLPVPMTDRRVGRLQAVVREMRFLEQ